ncbi:hypothetical protein GCM10023093_09110 [Nemorincola caseinilytica]|uniref:YD repeat-containing protein n=2 Tax=Nemorincola caseinilytica TaxID=2054315 RepID=A0ABP8NB07_9BACT
MGTSCKKRVHSFAPTPNNVRMLGYNRITTIDMSVPVPLAISKITESFRFYYDENNRVVQIIYTGNDSEEIHKRIDFSYRNDTIFKTITDILLKSVVERDTFIKNSDGFIVTTFTPGVNNATVKHNFEYLGKLMSRDIMTAANNRNVTMSSSVIYTSVDGDLLKQYPSKLDANFNDLVQGLDLDWIQTPKSYGHVEDLMSFSHTFSTYDPNQPMQLWVDDTLQYKDSLVYPAWEWSNQSYHFWTENANRIGDYMQLESFTKYGQNIYMNKHLVESISSPDKNAYITYEYDSDSKIKQTTVDLRDKYLNKYTYTYDIQYETY